MKNRLIPSLLPLAPFFRPMSNPFFITVAAGILIWFLGWGMSEMMGNYATHTLMDALKTVDYQVSHRGQTIASWRGIAYENIVLKGKGGETITVDAVSLSHPNRWLWWGRPSHIVIRGMRVPATVDLDFSTLFAKVLKKQQEAPGVQELILEDCQVGPDQVTLHGWARRLPVQKKPRGDDGEIEGRFYGRSITQKQFSGALFVASRFAKITVTGQDVWRTAPVGTLFFERLYETFTWQAHKSALNYTFSGKTRQLFKNNQGENRHPALTLQASLDMHKDKYVGQITAIEDAAQVILGTLYVNLSKSGEGILQVHVPPREWGAWADTLPATFPLLSAWRYVKGAMGITGVLSPTSFTAPLRGNVVVRGQDITVEGVGVRVEGLSGELILSQIWPRLESPTQQKITIQRLRFPHFDIDHAEIFLLNRGGLILKSLYADFLGGRLSLGEFREEAGKLYCRATLRAIHPGHFLRREKITAVDLVGHFSGHADVVWGDEGLELMAGHFSLSSSEVGLYVEDEQVITALFADHLKATTSEKKQPMTDQKMAFDALKALRCTIFSLDITPTPNKRADITLKIVGFNPMVLNGYPFEYLIETNGVFSEIARRFLLEKLRAIKENRVLPAQLVSP